MKNGYDSSKYFATLQGTELGSALMMKVDAWGEFLVKNMFLTELRRSYRAFYGSSDIEYTGAQGELVNIKVNHYSSILRGVLARICGERPAWKPRATNTDAKSQAETVLAAGVLDYYSTEKRLDDIVKDATEMALFLKEGWVELEWDTQAGDVVAVNGETMIHQGDIQFAVRDMVDVARDINKKSLRQNWYITTRYKNKYDMAAQYPELAEKILSLDYKRDSRYRLSYEPVSVNVDFQPDEVPVYRFYHAKSAAVPDGRMVEFADSDVILFDGPLPYDEIPLYPVTETELRNMPVGHTFSTDLLPIQDALDMVYSAITTNQQATAVQNIAYPKGSGIDLQSIRGGMNLIAYDKNFGPPTPLTLTHTAPEVFEFAKMLQNQMETLRGLPPVSRGNATGDMSGAAMALLESTSLSFSNSLQQSVVHLRESLGTAIIKILSRYASEPRMIAIVGKAQRSFLKEFSGDDVSNIARVTVESTNAVTKTAAGKLSIAQDLLNAGQIRNPAEYLQVLTTGNLQPLIEADQNQLLNIRAENEMLMEGKEPSALITDDHALHVLEHCGVLSSPEARSDAAIVQNTLSHAMHHISLAQSMPPALAMILKQKPLPPPEPQGPPPGAPQAQPSPMQQPPPGGLDHGVKGPHMPTVAGTHEQYQPPVPGRS